MKKRISESGLSPKLHLQKKGGQNELTRHNGRAGKNGAYNPKHNDRRFDIENSEHIDMECAKQNIYWDCYTYVVTKM